MNKNVVDIVNDVRTAIDEIGVNDSEFLSGADDTDLDTIIRGKLCEAVDWVHGSAVFDVMAGDVFEEKSVTDAGLNVSGMVRFVKGLGTGWNKAVTELTEEGTGAYWMAKDEFVGASNDRPAVLLEYVDGGKKVKLLPGGVGMVVIVPRCAVLATEETTPQEYVKVDSGVYAAMVEYLAGLTLMVLNDARGENMVQIAKGMIGIEAASPK